MTDCVFGVLVYMSACLSVCPSVCLTVHFWVFVSALHLLPQHGEQS